ncbi:MAG TPA: 3'-5' exonuclease, partial [Pirellulales bacterium]
MTAVKYLVFDIESIADGELVSRLRYPGEGLDPDTAVARYRQELMDEYGSDFIPYSYQCPLTVAAAKVSGDFKLLDLVLLDPPLFRPAVVVERFWRGWEAYQKPTWVSFNGRTFDMPLMELAAFRFGVNIGSWFGRSNSGPARSRYNHECHLDLMDVLTNFGATRFSGGLNLAAQLLGKPGKMNVQGDMVQDMYNQGRLAEIADYCRCDVLDTYFVFLRTRLMLGHIT